MNHTRLVLLTSFLLLLACESPPPASDAGAADATTPPPGDAAVPPTPICNGLASAPPSASCGRLASDYTPGADDTWPPCVTDDGEYHRVLPDISTIARVMAYEEIGALLFDPRRDPSAMEFLDARLIYQRDEGLDSRVVRRYDPHYAAPDGTDCAIDGVPEAFPEYCVGPASIGPRILEAFAAGIAGEGAEAPRVHAARIEAALLWFLAVSTYKESLTCTTTAKDCDSSYAYYTGGEAARGGIGLAGEVAAVAPSVHDRAWDGLLAVRCWRDLDPAEAATDLATRERAREQYDREVTRGVAAILRDRLVRACRADPAERAYHDAFVRVLAGYFDRAMRAADPAAADALAAAVTGPTLDATAAVTAIDAVFDCR